MSVIIKQATFPNDLKMVQEIGRETFKETFESQNTAEDMEKYLRESFSDDKLTKEMLNKDSSFYLAFINDKPAGYLKINFNDSQTEPDHPGSMELERIYVLQSSKRMGIGSKLLETAIERAKEAKVSHIWLGVWEHNIPAQKFYEKYGFIRKGSHTFVLGNDPQTDYIMEKAL